MNGDCATCGTTDDDCLGSIRAGMGECCERREHPGVPSAPRDERPRRAAGTSSGPFGAPQVGAPLVDQAPTAGADSHLRHAGLHFESALQVIEREAAEVQDPATLLVRLHRIEDELRHNRAQLELLTRRVVNLAVAQRLAIADGGPA